MTRLRITIGIALALLLAASCSYPFVVGINFLRPRIVVPQPDTAQILSEACGMYGLHGPQRFAELSETVLTYHWRAPVPIFVAASNVGAQRTNLDLMFLAGCDVKRDRWDRGYTRNTALQLRDDLALLISAAEWIETNVDQPKGTP